MEQSKLKAYLIQIAENLTENATLEDVYEQLAFFADIEESEHQEANGEVLSQAEVEALSKAWLSQ
jgi:hypothetical protein